MHACAAGTGLGLSARRRHLPIPGTKRRKYLQENIGALDATLASDDLASIDKVAPHEAVAGARYPDWAMQMVNR